jgi:hypothetical protein
MRIYLTPSVEAKTKFSTCCVGMMSNIQKVRVTIMSIIIGRTFRGLEFCISARFLVDFAVCTVHPLKRLSCGAAMIFFKRDFAYLDETIPFILLCLCSYAIRK